MRHFCWLMIVVGCWLVAWGADGRAWVLADDVQPGADHATAMDSAGQSSDAESAEEAEEPAGNTPAAATPSAPAAEPQRAEQRTAPTDGSEKSARPAEPAPAAQPEQPKPEEPKIHTVGRAALRIEVELDGMFEAQHSAQIALYPKQWSTFTVLETVAHGAEVKRGDVLAAFDPAKLEQAIADLRRELQADELEIERAEHQLALLEKTTALDLEAAERARRIAQEDRDYYKRVGRPLLLKSEEFSLKSAQHYLENEEEELRQLEKMYEADDLTEETEQIVLKRARFAVERARFGYEQAKESYEQTMRYLIPRRDVSIEEQTTRAELAWQAAQVNLPLNLRKQRAALEQLQEARRRAEEKLADLLADRELMTIRAPLDGVVYYGECQRGKFSDSDILAAELRPGNTVAARKVILTVVRTRPMFVRVTVPEGKLHLVRPGVRGVVEPAANPALKLQARVDAVGAIPFEPGNFDAQVRVKLGEEAAGLMPGMACRVKLLAYENKRALVVPASAVAADPDNPRKQYVYVLDERQKPRRRLVTTGHRSGAQVEILDGLAEGDRILQQYPKERP